jgi:hypothetical protein|tara:strand:- start:107 stop:601 length:495 start_codon:yes stop_codon:yes gene_type:complete
MSNNLNTVYGKAKYCYLTKPDEHFGGKDYSVTLELSKDKAREHIKKVDDLISKEVANLHKATPGLKEVDRAPLPYKIDGDLVTLKLHTQYKPKLWDKTKKELDPNVFVYKGSTLWANYKPHVYNKSMGLGVTLYLGHVQIDTLVEGGPDGGVCPFPERSQEVTL